MVVPETEIEFVKEVSRLADLGYSQGTIAVALGMTREQIRYRLEQHGFTWRRETRVRCRRNHEALAPDLIEAAEAPSDIELKAAISVAAAAMERLKAWGEVGAVFEPKVLDALIKIRRWRPKEWAGMRQALQKARVSLKDLWRAARNA